MNGNQVYQRIGKSKASCDYMRSNLPKHVYGKRDTTASAYSDLYYDYNNHDDRIYKKVQNSNGSSVSSYYLRDASGKELAEWDMINNSWIYYAYGRDRVAELEGSNGIVYYNYDHLGSVRVVYDPTSNCSGSAVIYKLDNMSDYYAFGKTLRTFGGDKYGYQGSEKNKELGDNDYYTHFRGLDVEIGRWRGVDPVYHAHESPYVSMGNNPVIFNDVLGNDWGIEKRVDPKSKKEIYDVTLNGVIINSSDKKISGAELNTLKKSMENQIKSAFSIDNEELQVNVSISLRVITNVDDAKSTDHVFNIVNSSELQGNLALGDFKGLQVKIGADGIYNMMYNNNTRTIPHEVGHTGGLDHPHGRGTEKPNPDATYPYEFMTEEKMQNNLMSQGWLPVKHQKSLTEARELTNSQLRLIYVNYINGAINYQTQFGESKGYRYIKK